MRLSLLSRDMRGTAGLADVTHIGPEEFAYFEVLNQRVDHLRDGEDATLCVVEGDTVIHDQVLDQFNDCPNDYCVFTYWIGASYGYGLGCTRFRASLIAANRDLVYAAAHRIRKRISIVGTGKRMDTRIRDEARETRAAHHLRLPG